MANDLTWIDLEIADTTILTNFIRTFILFSPLGKRGTILIQTGNNIQYVDYPIFSPATFYLGIQEWHIICDDGDKHITRMLVSNHQLERAER